MTKERPTLLEFIEELERAERYLSECEHPLREGFVPSEVPDTVAEMQRSEYHGGLRQVVIGGVVFDLRTDEGWTAFADMMTTCFVCHRPRWQCICGR